MDKLTQNEGVLKILKANENKWVPLLEIIKFTSHHCESMSLNIHSRISDLRKKGHTIENKVEQEGRAKKSFYRLVTAKFLERI